MAHFHDVDVFIERLLMGEAYKEITSQMGPSAHLIALVNHDNITNDSLGLESFDIVSQHEKILAEIDASDFLGMATESFGGRLKSIMEKVKNAVTFNKADNLNDMHDSKLQVKKSSIYVPSYAHVEKAMGLAMEAVKTLDKILPMIPKGKDLSVWEKFYEAQTKDRNSSPLGTLIRNLVRSQALLADLGKQVDFEKSGWTDTNFKKMIGELSDLQIAYENREAKLTDACSDLREVTSLVEASQRNVERDKSDRVNDVTDSIKNAQKERNDPTKKDQFIDIVEKSGKEINRQQRLQQHNMLMRVAPAHVVAAMNQVATAVDTALSNISRADHMAHKGLKNVSRHFEIVT